MAGPLAVTRYNFDIAGRAYALQLQVSARATDVAGHTTTVTATVTVKSPTSR